MILFRLFLILRHSCLNLSLSLSFPMYLSLYLSFLFVFAMTSMTFPKVFYGIHPFPQGPLLRTSKCIEGWVGWGRKWGVRGLESNCLMYQYPKFIPLLFNKLMLMNLSEAICTGFVLISKSFAIYSSFLYIVHSCIFCQGQFNEIFEHLFLQNIKSQPNTK